MPHPKTTSPIKIFPSENYLDEHKDTELKKQKQS